MKRRAAKGRLERNPHAASQWAIVSVVPGQDYPRSSQDSRESQDFIYQHRQWQQMATAALSSDQSSASPLVHPSFVIRRPFPSTSADKIREGQRLKDLALELLRRESPKPAALLFKKCFAYTRGLLPRRSSLADYALAAGQHDTVIDATQEESVRVLELACNEGLAKIYLDRATSSALQRQRYLEQALSYSEKVLLSEPENVKGLFRAGQLHLRMRNIYAAKRCLTRAAKYEPQNVAIRSELRNLSRLAQESGGELAADGITAGSSRVAGHDNRAPRDRIGRT